MFAYIIICAGTMRYLSHNKAAEQKLSEFECMHFVKEMVSLSLFFFYNRLIYKK